MKSTNSAGGPRSAVFLHPAKIGTSGAIEPYFSQLDVIYCNFGGVGWELDEPHYAIVWNDDHTEEKLTVIPTTSKFTREYADEFNVKRITGLPKTDTILTVSKMMKISRKRVILHPKTQMYLQGKLMRAWKYRIEYAIAIAFGHELPLEYYVRENCGIYLPTDFTTHYLGIRYMPVQHTTSQAFGSGMTHDFIRFY